MWRVRIDGVLLSATRSLIPAHQQTKNISHDDPPRAPDETHPVPPVSPSRPVLPAHPVRRRAQQRHRALARRPDPLCIPRLPLQIASTDTETTACSGVGQRRRPHGVRTSPIKPAAINPCARVVCPCTIASRWARSDMMCLQPTLRMYAILY